VERRDVYLPPPAREPAPISRRALLRFGFGARARSEIDFAGVTERVRLAWESGGSEPLLRALEPVAEAAVELAGVHAGERVLDAGAGDGNVALAAVSRGADVDACDLAAAMVARGRERCPGARWTRADVQALPYDDGAFDVVISTFGAALAPRARQTAHELARVLRSRGRLVLAAWAPRGLPGRLDEHRPLPDGVQPPSAWADQAIARRRLEPLLEGLARRTRTVALGFESPDAMFAAMRSALVVADDVRPAFDRLLAAQNNRPPAAEIDARYVLYAARRAS
jgi:SAM-dependent methyltransferase